MKKFITVVVLVLIILIAAFLLYYFVFKSLGAGGKIGDITQNDARKVAEANLSFFESWKQPSITAESVFTDLKGVPSAYFFEVGDYYGKAGFMVISASDREDPVIKISKTEEPPTDRSDRFIYSLVEGTIHSPGDVRKEMIYLGGSNFLVKLTFLEGTVYETKYYDLRQIDQAEAKDVLPLTQEELSSFENFFNDLKEKGADKKWKDSVK